MRTRWAGFGLAMMLACGASREASAVMAPNPLDHPLPEALRPRAEAMIRALRSADADAAVASLRTTLGVTADAEFVILRVEAGCQAEQCMTVLARSGADGMVPEVILNAGNVLMASDHAVELWRGDAWPVYFQGAGGSTLRVVWWAGRWVVDACAACFPWADVKQSAAADRPTLPPPRSAPSMSLGEVRRQLGLED